MRGIYHRQVLQRALGAQVSARALAAITRANLNQDNLSGLVGHPEYHFDDGLFAESLKYIEDQRALAAQAAWPAKAWAAFGRLSHAAQDFYSHSNYVALWMEQGLPSPVNHPERSEAKSKDPDGALRGAKDWGWPPVTSIDGLDPALLKHPRLRSGRVYWPVEALWILPPFRPLVKRLVPKDSHAWMNLDSPAAGPLFPYSIEAAVQRTLAEFERTLAAIGEERGEEAVKASRDM